MKIQFFVGFVPSLVNKNMTCAQVKLDDVWEIQKKGSKKKVETTLVMASVWRGSRKIRIATEVTLKQSEPKRKANGFTLKMAPHPMFDSFLLRFKVSKGTYILITEILRHLGKYV